MRALLVEDDLSCARGVTLMLRSAGAVVDHADTGEEALELVRHYDYDIVVLDLMLPDIEGYDVIRRMRAARIEVPVLILSGLTRPQAKVKALALGADDFVAKPFDKAELIARLQAVIRRSKGFSQEAFLNHLYGGMDEPEMKIIDVFICKLRKKLALAGADSLIGTVWGRGYMIREPQGTPRMPTLAPEPEAEPPEPMEPLPESFDFERALDLA
jgi:two-component system cell cycle response regulator CtrA